MTGSVRYFAALAVACALLGCSSYDIVQSNIFADDDGNVVTIGYGRSDSVHINTFRNPATGKDMEFKSKLVVEVTLPDGDDFTAWQCMNFMRTGTMYRTDDEAWMILVNGFSCIIYEKAPEGDRYNEVFRGILCESPNTDYKPKGKWRNLKKNASGGWR